MKNKLRTKPFSFGWWCMVAFVFVAIGAINLICAGKSIQFKINFMKGFGLMLPIYFTIYKWGLYIDKEFDFHLFNEFPFQLCNITTIILPLSLFLNHPILQCFCFVIGVFGPSMALLMPDVSFIDVPVFSIRGLGFYGYHLLLIIAGICLVTLGIYTPEYSHIPYLLVMLFVLMFTVHGINIIFRSTHIYDDANYMYTYGLEPNPILRKLKQIIQINCVYEIPLLPVAGLVGLIMTFISKLF